MRRTTIPFIVVLAQAVFAASVYAAPVSLPSSSKPVRGEMWQHRNGRLEFSLGLEVDYIARRELDEADAEISAGLYGVKLDFSLAAREQQAFDLILVVGNAYGITFDAVVANKTIDFEMNNHLYFGAGIVQSYTYKPQKIQMMINVMYRTMDADADATVTAAQPLDGDVSLTWTEWHAAFVVAKKFERAVPYIGLKYSDITVDAKATAGGNNYVVSGAHADKSVGMFAGLSLKFGRGCTIDIEGRFGDEQAFSAGFNYTF